MANLSNIVKLTQAQFDILAAGGTITKGGKTYSYDANALYMVEDTGGVPYITTAPSSDNTNGNLIIVVLDSEPATYYDGYYYIITDNS